MIGCMFKTASRVSLLFAFILLLQGCQPQKGDDSGVPMAPEESRSPAFEPVAAELSLGGDMYVFWDMTRMAEQFGDAFPALMEGFTTMPGMDQEAYESFEKISKIDWSEFLTDLGFAEHTAIGMSAYRMRNGNYRNQSILYLPEGYEGLMRFYSGEMGSLEDELKLAPADTDIFYSFGMNLNELKPVIGELIGKYAGKEFEHKFNEGLQQALPKENITMADIWERLPTRVTFVGKVADMTIYPFPASPEGMMQLPKLEFVLALQGNSAFWRELIDKQLPPSFEKEDLGSTTLVLSPEGMRLPGELSPCLGFDSENDRLYLASSPAYIKSALGDSPRLSTQPAYAQATEGLRTEDALDMLFLSSNAYSKIAATRESLTASQPFAGFSINLYSMYFPILTAGPHDSATARVMLRTDKGLISEENWAYPSSMAGLSMGSGSQTVVVTGLLAAMAIPAFNKVREQSREKAIVNNLRQVASAGQQYILEEGASSVSYDKLEGVYFPSINPVAGEDYTGLEVSEEGGTLTVTTAGGEEVSYTY